MIIRSFPVDLLTLKFNKTCFSGSLHCCEYAGAEYVTDTCLAGRPTR